MPANSGTRTMVIAPKVRAASEVTPAAAMAFDPRRRARHARSAVATTSRASAGAARLIGGGIATVSGGELNVGGSHARGSATVCAIRRSATPRPGVAPPPPALWARAERLCRRPAICSSTG
jgi:hypothetical protein